MKVYERNGVCFADGEDSYHLVMNLLETGAKNFYKHKKEFGDKCKCKYCRDHKRLKGYRFTWWDIPDRKLTRLLRKIKNERKGQNIHEKRVAKWLKQHGFKVVFDSEKK